MFKRMKENNMPQTEHMQAGEFWAKARRLSTDNLDMFGFDELNNKPCECTF